MRRVRLSLDSASESTQLNLEPSVQVGFAPRSVMSQISNMSIDRIASACAPLADGADGIARTLDVVCRELPASAWIESIGFTPAQPAGTMRMCVAGLGI